MHTVHTVELLQQAIEVARQVGYTVQQDWLGGVGSGHCLVRGRKLLLLDLSQPARDQLNAVQEAVRGEIHLPQAQMSEELAELLDVRSVA